MAFSLGAAFLLFPAADGFETPDVQAPVELRDVFLAQHADAAVRQGIFTSCRGGRDLILRSAPSVSLTLHLNPTDAHHSRVGMLQAAWQALLVRRDRPVTLALQYAVQPTAITGVLHDIRVHLLCEGAEQAVTTLRVQGPSAVHSSAVAQVRQALGVCVQSIAPALPNLSRLVLRGSFQTLPPPSQLPRLVALDVMPTDSAGSLADSIALYVGQLSTLRLWTGVPTLVRRVLSWGGASQSLTELRLCGTRLDDVLLGLIVDHVPRLERLHVAKIQRLGLGQQNKQWGLRELIVSDQEVVDSDNLMRLPRRQAAHTLHVTCKAVSFSILFELGIAEDQRERMPGWVLSVNSVHVSPFVVFHNHERAALRNALQQLADLLRTLDGGALRVDLLRWHWDTELAQVLASSLPLLHTQLNIGITLATTLTDTILETLLHAGPHMHRLACPGIRLRSDTHANTPWPWDEIVIEKKSVYPTVKDMMVDLGDVARLPKPGGAMGVCTLRLDKGLVTSKDDVARLAVWAQHVKWVPATEGRKTMLLTISPPKASGDCVTDTHTDTDAHTDTDPDAHTDAGPHTDVRPHTNSARSTDTLRALGETLSALSALPAHTFSDSHKLRVCLCGYAIDEPTIESLQRLPLWEGAVLDLTQCTFPCEAAAYKRVGACVPACYVDCDAGRSVSRAIADSISAGFVQHRADLG